MDAAKSWDSLGEDRKPLTDAQLNRELRRRRANEQADREAETRTQTPGWIYYVRIGDRIKIGYSADVKRRLRAYPPDSELLAVHPGTPGLEAQIHRDFAGSRADGREWFYQHDDLMRHIAEVVTQFGSADRFAHRYRTGRQVRPKDRLRR